MDNPVAGTSRETTSRPTSPSERHHLVDAMRGFALLGIVVVNAEFILDHADVGWAEHTSTIDLLIRWLITTVAELKVYPLFALLFGYGLSVQLQHATSGSAAMGPRYRRRMLGLILLGTAHAVLFFPGDILVVYALVGLLAFALRRLSNRRLISLAVSIYATASVVWLILGFVLLAGGDVSESPSANSLQALSAGSFGNVVAQHALDWPVTVVFLGLLQGPAAFSFVLVGVALGRTDMLTNPAAYRGLARKVLLLGATLGWVGGGVGAAFMVCGGRFTVLGLAIGFLVAPAMTSAYVAALMLAWSHLPRALAAVLQAGGRMSLSVYLLQSVALSTLSYGYGGGLFETLRPLEATALAIAVWVALSLFAMGWLRYSRFGPVEWALRSFSYWRIQPLTISTASSHSPRHPAD